MNSDGNEKHDEPHQAEAISMVRPGAEKVDENDMKSIEDFFNKAWLPKVYFVTVIGNYQTGKSTKITLLTGFKGIETGDSMNETTFGTNAYGPFSLNYIRERFGLPPSDEDACIFFFDTEGINGFEKGDVQDENHLRIERFIAPMAAISDVILTVTIPNIRNEDVQTFKSMFAFFNQILHEEKRKFKVINVVNDFVRDSDNYDEVKARATKTFLERFEIDDDVFPLPQFNINDPLDGQRPFYNEVFKHFATRLLQILENSPICLSSSSAFELFKELVSSTEDKDWKRLIMDARIKAKKREYERILGRIDQEITQTINNVYKNNQELLQQNKIITYAKLEPEIFVNYWMDELQKRAPQILNEEGSFLKELTEEWKNSVKERFEKVINQNEKEIEQHNKTFILNETNNKLKSIISEIYSTQEFEQNKIEQSIKSQIQDFLKTFNQNNEIESIKEEINIEIEKTIHKYIQDLRSKIITTQSEEIYNNKSENLKEDFESKINEIKNLNNFKIEYFNLNMIFSDIFNEIKHKMPFINCQEQWDEALKFSQIFKDKIQKYNDQLQRILEEKRREIFEQTMNKIIEEKLEFLNNEMRIKDNEIENLNNCNIEYFDSQIFIIILLMKLKKN